jgi:atypical dual specificity phosphatase
MIESELKTIKMNFGWVENGLISGCRGPRSAEDLAFLASKGIKALVRLEYEEETGISKHDVMNHGIEDCYEPVKDYTKPSPEQINRVIRFIRKALDQHKPVAVSCGAGYGRTATILACYLVTCGLTADQAIKTLIQIRPVSEEILHIPGQREAVVEFAQRFPKFPLKNL